MRNYIGFAAIIAMVMVVGCGGGSYKSPLSGDYSGSTNTNTAVKIPDVKSGSSGTVAVNVNSSNNFVATITYTTTSGTTYPVTFTGDASTNIQGNNNAFNATETDKNGPYYGQTLEVYYHTYSATSKYPTGFTLAEYPNGFTQINVYPNSTPLPPSVTTPAPLWSMVVAQSSTGTTGTTTGTTTAQ